MLTPTLVTLWTRGHLILLGKEIAIDVYCKGSNYEQNQLTEFDLFSVWKWCYVIVTWPAIVVLKGYFKSMVTVPFKLLQIYTEFWSWVNQDKTVEKWERNVLSKPVPELRLQFAGLGVKVLPNRVAALWEKQNMSDTIHHTRFHCSHSYVTAKPIWGHMIASPHLQG